MGSVRRGAQVLVLATTVVLGIVTLTGARGDPGQTIGGGQPWALGLELAAGLGTAGAGARLWRRRGYGLAGTLLVATGLAVFLQQLPMPGDGGPLPFTAGLVGGAMTGTLAGSAALSVPGVARRPWDAPLAIAALAIAALGLGLIPAVLFSPKANGCFSCAGNLVLIESDPSAYNELVSTSLKASAIACALLGALIILRVIARPDLLRSVAAPIIVGGAAAAGLAAALFAHEAELGLPEIDGVTHALWLGQCAWLVAGATGLALVSLYVRALRQKVASMVLKAQPSAHVLRAALRATLGDAHLEIVFPRADGAPLDAEGREVPPASEDISVAAITRHGELIAQLRHTEWLSHTPERLIEAAKGAGLALEHASLHARLKAEIYELAASRARIIEMGDAERRRLERNLHDGAQQRLISLAMDLSSAPGPDGEVAQAKYAVQHALDSLRSIAHGIHPVSLSESGLLSASAS